MSTPNVVKVKLAINAGPVGYSEIQSRTGLNARQVGIALSTLAKQGLCRRLPAVQKKRRFVGVTTLGRKEDMKIEENIVGLNCVYIAGPMSGIPDLNFTEFHRVAARYRSLGVKVVNPAEINVDPAKGWSECMRADIRELVTCDAIVMLPGWEGSKGANLELHIARSLGMTVFYMMTEAEA